MPFPNESGSNKICAMAKNMKVRIGHTIKAMIKRGSVVGVKGITED